MEQNTIKYREGDVILLGIQNIVQRNTVGHWSYEFRVIGYLKVEMEQNTIKANMEVVGRRRYIAGNEEYCSKEIQWALVVGI